MNTTNKGRLGEDIASMYLMKHGYTIVCRNYWRKWGEIDIIAENKGTVYFVEVKTVTAYVSHGTNRGAHRPEDNVSLWKRRKLSRVVETYLHSNELYESGWKFLVVSVVLNMKNRRATVTLVEDML